MACLSVVNGLFITNTVWLQGPGPVSTPGGVTLTLNTSGPNPGLTVQKGASVQFFAKPASGSVRFVTFGNPANYILVLTITGTTRSVVHVDATGPTLTTELLSTSDVPNAVSLPDVQPSPSGAMPGPGNGSVFVLVTPTSSTTVGALMCRSDNGAVLCAATPFNPSQQVIGEATATQLRIKEGGNIVASCAKPVGKADITPDPRNFPDAVIGAGVDPALSTRIEQVTIRNDGNDCLTINAITDTPPYSVASAMPAVGATLEPGQSMIVSMRFAPTSIGQFNVDVPVTRTPANGDAVIRCRGRGRAPVLSVSFSGTVSFGSVPLGGTGTRNLTITNNGEAAVTVNVPASTPGSDFQWAAAGQSLAPGAALIVAITFTPTAEGPRGPLTLTFTSTAAGGSHSVTVNGTGCVARARIDVVVPAPGPGIDFANVQRGFRTVRIVRVRNTGNGSLSFRARTTGALFGLQQIDGSITAPPPTLNFSVNPPTVCGAGATGSGEVVFAVIFFANDVPGPAAGELIIDNHNATAGSPPASFTIPLSASITTGVAVDAELVLDRSGSMSESSGPRTKIETAIAAARLFVALGRPDVDDRIGIVRFNATPEAYSSIEVVTAANQATIVNRINSTELTASGETAIAGGVLTALADLAAHPRATPPADMHSALVVLTDGKDNAPFTNSADGVEYTLLGENGTTALPIPAGTAVYAIGIGDNIDTGRLGQLAQATNGQFLHVLDFGGLDYFKLEKHFTQIYMDMVDLAVLSDPTYTIQPAAEHVIDFDVLRGDTALMIVVYDREQIRIPFWLVTPEGALVDPGMLPPGFSVRTGMTTSARFLELGFPLNEVDRYAGHWKLVVRHDGRACFASGRPLEVLAFGSQPRECKPYDKPIMYGFAIGVGSNFRMAAYVDPAIVRVGEPIQLNALVTEFGLPVTDAQVEVTCKTPGGSLHVFKLADDGAHSDDAADDGNYGRAFSQTYAEGTYEFTFRTTGMTRDGEPVKREAVRAKYVEGRQPLQPTGDKKDCCSALVKWLRIGVAALVLIAIVLILIWRNV